MSRSFKQEVSTKIQFIPALPAALQKLANLTQNAESNHVDVVEVISNDQVLTGRVLRAANSPMYGLTHKVGTVSQAVSVLGFGTIRNLALGVSVFGAKMSSNDASSIDREEFWRHSLAVASASRELAQIWNDENPGEIFVGGLLHDIGQVVLLEFFPEIYTQIMHAAAERRIPLRAVEIETLGLDHVEVGVMLCEHWKIPSSVIRVVSEHHHYDGNFRFADPSERRVLMVQIADYLAQISQIGTDWETSISHEFLQVLEQPEIDGECLRKVLLALPEIVRKAEIFFELASPQTSDKPGVRGDRSVAVCMGDRKYERMVEMLLLSKGFALIDKETLDAKGGFPQAVIYDQTIQPEYLEKLRNEKVMLIDFAEWSNQQDREKNSIDLNLIRDWLSDQLGASSNEILLL